MKWILIPGLWGFLALATTFNLQAQDTQTLIRMNQDAYGFAMQNNDMTVAVNKLYNLIALDPGNDSLKLNLSYIYFERKMYASSVLVAQQVLKNAPDQLEALQLSAVCFEALGLKDRSLQAYQKLFIQDDNVRDLYKMAFLQYDLKKYDECKTNIDILLGRKDLEGEKAVFNIDDKTQKQFPMKVSVLNLKGLVYQDTGDPDTARQAFQDALALSPDFPLAKQNLDNLDKGDN